MLALTTKEDIREAERAIADRKRELEHAKWDAELVGRYFRIIRTPEAPHAWLSDFAPLPQEDYVTLEGSLAVGGENHYVYADVVFLHIQQRDDWQLRCAGFEVSHANRREPYIKIQPVFYSIHDFRGYLNSSSLHTGPTKHFDEISKEDYESALADAVKHFTAEYRR